MTYNTNTPLSGFDLTYAHGLATISLTRTSDTSLSYAVGYYKADGSRAELDGTTRSPVALTTLGWGYGGDTRGDGDGNLSYTAASPNRVQLASLVYRPCLGLLCYAWSKRK